MKAKDFDFSTEKNAWLIEERGISFEEVIAAILNDDLLDVIDHPNQEKYGHQEMYIMYVRNYVYLVPYVIQKDDTVFLKTITPSRKAKKLYLEENGYEH